MAPDPCLQDFMIDALVPCTWFSSRRENNGEDLVCQCFCTGGQRLGSASQNFGVQPQVVVMGVPISIGGMAILSSKSKQQYIGTAAQCRG